MRTIQPVIWCIVISTIIISGCISPDSDQTSGKNETIVTPFGEIVITAPIPLLPRESPIYKVTGSGVEETKPTTEIQESGPWKGFPIPFTATEEWSIQTIRNYSDDACLVTRDYTNFASDNNITFISVMGVGLGINRTPRAKEYASTIIENSIWKGTPRVRKVYHMLNETGTVRILPLRTLLQDLTADQTIGGFDESIFPFVVNQIEFGYFHRSRRGPCGDIEMWEPAWILSGTTRNETSMTLWVWAADPGDVRTHIKTPRPFPEVQGIITYTGKGVQFSNSPPGGILPFPNTWIVSEFDRVESDNRDTFFVHCLTPYPSFPSTMMVYQDVTTIDEDAVRVLAHNIGMDGTVEASPEVIWVRDEERELSVSPGFIHYRVLNRPNGVLDEVNLTPAKDEATARAIVFLTESGLYEPGTIPDAYIGGSGLFSNNTTFVRYQTMRVIFLRTIEGTRVFKNSISVEVGGNGDIVEVTKKWGEYQPFRKYPLISPQEAYQHLLKSDMIDGYEKALGSLYMELYRERSCDAKIGPLLVKVSGVSLEYYGRDTMESGLLRPAYKFEYEFLLENRRLPATFFVPAVPELGIFEDWNFQALT